MMGSEHRVSAFGDVLARFRERAGLSFGFELWDGSLIPSDLPPDALRIRFADEGTVAALMRRPRLDTLVKLHVEGRIDWINGTLFDLAAARPSGRARQILGAVGWGRIAATLARFLTVRVDPARPIRPTEQPEDYSAKRRDIAHHYDVSNAFYRLFLDPDMVYTCAYFSPDWHDDLARAQRDKLDMICRKLRLARGEKLLDIGCGWGALVCHAAEHYGVEALGVTLSIEQAELAREKVRERGLSDRVRIELQDFARLGEAQFDKIASIGMFEHVGIDHHPDYFRAVHRLLKPRGLYLHHAITRPAKGSDAQFRQQRAEYKAILRYIFPGAELDHIGMSVANLERHKFEVHDVEGWREHYARTTRLWHDRLWAARAQAEAEVGAATTRLWLLYLAGVSLGFERGALGIFQTLASKRTRGPAGLPPTRAGLYRERVA
jgi:cyclopropane-fatty-acyl-phospholipid synthase